MSETIVGILGLITIVAIVLTLFKSKTQPAIAFIMFPALLGLILVLGGRYDFDQLASMIKQGFSSTGPTAALFVFSVLYFGIMTDAGMFDVIIGKLMTLVGDNVIGVAVVTAVIALVGHLDGGGASTFCIVVPAMLPVYKRMHMRPSTLLRIAVLAMGVLNLMPWAGPTMRAASVLGMEAGSLWQTILPIQIFGIILAIGHAVLAGWQEKRRGAGLNGRLAQTEGIVEVEDAQTGASDSELARPKLFLFNILLTVAVIAMLIWDVFPSYFPFMLGVAIALFVNYGFTAKMHKKIINLHAGPALMMCSTLMGAAVLMGILTTSWMTNDAGNLVVASVKVMDGLTIPSVVRCLANLVAGILPQALGQQLPLVIGILSVPLALAFDTDSYFYGMLPVMIGIGQAFGVDAMPIAVAMVVCRNCATFISPMVPATLLGTGLAEVDIKDHIKCSFLYVWGFSILCMIFAVIIGIMPL
ncbi:MAG: SLC13 family permease [Clostridia bacterium]|nr:SLC13 family permease [Clostridia bacterium]